MVIATHSYRNSLGAAALALLLAGLVPAIAEASRPAGRVISVSGDVTAVRAGESARSLHFRDLVREGDEVRTGPDANAQIRLNDGGLVELKSASRFAIDRYGPDPDGAGSSALMRFLQGALRTVTGAIGDHRNDTYEMKTAIATIGVRGTGYSLQYCDAACVRSGVGEPGLYGRVEDGVIYVRTTAGSVDFAAGEYLFVAGSGAELPKPIVQPPGNLLEGVDRRKAAASATAPELAPAVRSRRMPPFAVVDRTQSPLELAQIDELPSWLMVQGAGLLGPQGLPPDLAGRAALPSGLPRRDGLPPQAGRRLPVGIP